MNAASRALADFEASHGPGKRVVSQARAHATIVQRRLQQRPEHPPRGTLAHCDVDAAKGNAARTSALTQMSSHLEALDYGVRSSLQSLQMHLSHDTFYGVPARVVARALLENAANGAWILDSGVTGDMRHARGCASALRALDLSIKELDAGRHPSPEVLRFRQMREQVVQHFESGRTIVVRRKHRKTGETLDEVSSVRIGGVVAKVQFNISQRVNEFVNLDGVYSTLSLAVHGEPTMLAGTTASPGTQVRAVARTAFRSVEAWSREVPTYVGVEPAVLINPNDLARPPASFPEDVVLRQSSRTAEPEQA